jgi:hypothetical protein
MLVEQSADDVVETLSRPLFQAIQRLPVLA